MGRCVRSKCVRSESFDERNDISLSELLCMQTMCQSQSLLAWHHGNFICDVVDDINHTQIHRHIDNCTHTIRSLLNEKKRMKYFISSNSVPYRLVGNVKCLIGNSCIGLERRFVGRNAALSFDVFALLPLLYLSFPKSIIPLGM